jgi:hypothetical protein
VLLGQHVDNPLFHRLAGLTTEKRNSIVGT